MISSGMEGVWIYEKFFLLILAALILIPTVFSSGITSNAAAKNIQQDL